MTAYELAYPTMVFVHVLLFVAWLGGDIGVFVLGQHFRRRHDYTLDQRMALLKLLVIVDLAPRAAWALMVPVSLTVSLLGNWWPVWPPLVWISWVLAAGWLWLVFDAHRHDMTPRAARNRRWEGWLRYLLCAGFLLLGAESMITGHPVATPWIAAKILCFGLIFAAAIMIDIRFKPVGPQLARLLSEGSSEATEEPLLQTMNRTRRWVWLVYALLLVTGWLGVVKPDL